MYLAICLALWSRQADCSLWTILFGDRTKSDKSAGDAASETDDSSTERIFQPEDRPKTYSVKIDRLHPKTFEMNQTQKIVEFSEYNETTKSFSHQFIVGNISTQIFKTNPNITAFVLNDKLMSNREHNENIHSKSDRVGSSSTSQKPTKSPAAIKTPSKPSSQPTLRVHDQKSHHKVDKQQQQKTSELEPYVIPRKYPSTDPVPHQSHDHYEKHIREALKDADSGMSKLVFIGDSIFSQLTRDSSVRDALFSYHPLNLASPGFRTEHMLYRFTTSLNIHKSFSAPVFVVLIGTFNIGVHHTAEETKEGVLAIVNVLRRSTSKSSRIVVCSILPRQSISLNKNIDETNKLVRSSIRTMDRVHFLYLDGLFKHNSYPSKLQNDRYFMPDHLHPSEEGYHAIIRCLKPFLIKFDAVANKFSPPAVNITKTLFDTLI
jgi:lysophospholipase L1-like esterase